MIDQNEKRWLAGFILVVIVITTLPYIIGYVQQTPDWKFSGILFSLTDSNSYLAKMLRGSEGDWLFRTPYTVNEQTGMVAFFPYILLGKLTAEPGRYDQLIVLFQAFRVSGIALVTWAIYRFFSRFIESISLRRFGIIFTVMGGGVGWLAVIGLDQLWDSRLPLEFYSPETFGFLSFLGIPHLLFSRALLILGLETFLFSIPSRDNIAQTIKFVIPWILIGFFQPISIVTTWGIIACFVMGLLIFRNFSQKFDNVIYRRYLKNAGWIAVLTLPFLLYNLIVFRVDPVLVSWMNQNILTSPPVQDYLLAFILILPLSIMGLIVYWRMNKVFFLFFAVWLFIFPILAYFPISIQRRLPEGIWIMLVLTALVAINSMRKGWKNFAIAILSLGMVSSLMILVGAFQSVQTPIPPRFISSKELEAIQFLQKPEYKNAHVLASFNESNRLAARSPVFLLTGLGPESANLGKVTGLLNRFYQNKMTSIEENLFLEEYKIDLVFYGPEEKEIGAWAGRNRPNLVRLFTNDDFEIYSVNGVR